MLYCCVQGDVLSLINTVYRKAVPLPTETVTDGRANKVAKLTQPTATAQRAATSAQAAGTSIAKTGAKPAAGGSDDATKKVLKGRTRVVFWQLSDAADNMAVCDVHSHVTDKNVFDMRGSGAHALRALVHFGRGRFSRRTACVHCEQVQSSLVDAV